MKRKIIWISAVLLILVYFCLVPSRLKISPETTGVTAPLKSDGSVDYFAAYENTYKHKFYPVEDNGQALLIAACGPVVLEQTRLMQTVPWEELPTNELSKKYFADYWLPLCEHMGIDPYKKPRFLENRGFYGFMQKLKEAKKKESDDENFQDDDPESKKLWEKLVSAPWKAEEYPDVAKWLEEHNPVLDLYAKCVRKPNYVCWKKRANDLLSILLPDVQSNRDFARSLRVRIAHRLAIGDIDGAWHDAMSMFYLCRKHYAKDPILVTKFVGFAIEKLGYEAAVLILKEGNPSKEQLERFANELNALPPLPVFIDIEEFEAITPYAFNENILETVKSVSDMSSTTSKNAKIIPFYSMIISSYLPIDKNIAGRRLTKLREELNNSSNDSAWQYSPVSQQVRANNQEMSLTIRQKNLASFWNGLRVPLIRTRSELVADIIFRLLRPYEPMPNAALNECKARFGILKTAIALDRYKLKNGEYPETLDSLIPNFLDIIPLDPFYAFGIKNLQDRELKYKRNPEDGVSYIIYSAGREGKNDLAFSRN